MPGWELAAGCGLFIIPGAHGSASIRRWKRMGKKALNKVEKRKAICVLKEPEDAWLESGWFLHHAVMLCRDLVLLVTW